MFILFSNSLDSFFLKGLQDKIQYFLNHINHPDSNINDILIILISILLIKELFILIYVDGFITYFLSLQNFMESVTYILSLISLCSIYFHSQSSYGSVAVLFSYILLPIFLQKFKAIGVYVIAFKRTLVNSSKLFPVFLILFIGFVLSFKVRSNFGVNYSETDSLGYSLIRTITMVIGELDSSKMGLDSSQSGLDSNETFPNLLIYFLFIGLMCTIFLNLFVGIAVDDIKKILDEADIQLICTQIFYVLRIQKAVLPLYNYFGFLKKILNMNFKKYNSQNVNKLLRLADSLKEKTFNYLSKEDQNINLADPIKRLENTLKETSREMNEKFEYFEQKFSNKLYETESKINNAQIRLQESLNEFLVITENQMKTFRDILKSLEKKINSDLSNLQVNLKTASKESVTNVISKPTSLTTTKTEYFTKSANAAQFFAESSTTKIFANENEKKRQDSNDFDTNK